MASILLVTTAQNPDHLDDDKRRLYTALTDRRNTVHLINPRKVTHWVSQGRIGLSYRGDHFPDIDHVICFGTAGRERSTGLLIENLKRRGDQFTILDGDRYMKADTTKLFTSVDRAFRGVGPETYVAFDAKRARTVAAHLRHPLVVKPIDGRRGEGVKKLASITDTLAAIVEHFPEGHDLDYPIMFQAYIPIKYEYRVVLLNGRAIGIVRKSQRANPEQAAGFDRMVQWGGGVFARTAHRRPIAAAEEYTSSREGLLGLDIVWSRADNRYYIIEENRAPGAWAEFERVAGVSIADNIADLYGEIRLANPNGEEFDEEEEEDGFR